MTQTLNVRLTFRQEGAWWNCYVAKPDTMKGAFKLGSIVFAGARDSEACKDAFMTAMNEAFIAFCRAEYGITPAMGNVTVGPEHERAGGA